MELTVILQALVEGGDLPDAPPVQHRGLDGKSLNKMFNMIVLFRMSSV